MIRTARTILRKDLAIELRTKESVPAMTLFTVTVFVLFHFGLDRDALEGDLASGVLWVTLLLAAVIGVTRLFAIERERQRRHDDGGDRQWLEALGVHLVVQEEVENGDGDQHEDHIVEAQQTQPATEVLRRLVAAQQRLGRGGG